MFSYLAYNLRFQRYNKIVNIGKQRKLNYQQIIIQKGNLTFINFPFIIDLHL